MATELPNMPASAFTSEKGVPSKKETPVLVALCLCFFLLPTGHSDPENAGTGPAVRVPVRCVLFLRLVGHVKGWSLILFWQPNHTDLAFVGREHGG